MKFWVKFDEASNKHIPFLLDRSTAHALRYNYGLTTVFTKEKRLFKAARGDGSGGGV